MSNCFYFVVNIKIMVIILTNLMILCLLHDDLVSESVELCSRLTAIYETILGDTVDDDEVLFSEFCHVFHQLLLYCFLCAVRCLQTFLWQTEIVPV